MVQNTQPVCSRGGAMKYLFLIGIIYSNEKVDLRDVFLFHITSL